MAESSSTADTLRERFRSIPESERGANQAFSIRVWWGLSWLERAEGANDVEVRFISLWIAFNAIYGYLYEGANAPDHASWQEFLAKIVKADGQRVYRVIQRTIPAGVFERALVLDAGRRPSPMTSENSHAKWTSFGERSKG